jgi:hypothetical protein
MTKAFVLGNGRSRLNARPKKLRKHGKIYGCNALYREFDPDFLIAVDPKMIIEICENGYQLTHEVWTNPNTRYKTYKNLNFFKNPRGWSSGPTALLKACTDGNKEVFILGFDYYGVGNNFNNVYADTPNYKKSTDIATFYGNWMRQTETVMKEFPSMYFFRVVDNNTKEVSEWNRLNNFKHITYDEMFRMLGPDCEP